ncbi:hypothetical protein DFR68_12555 [Nocardia mexicana]|uniref:Uncharacterized protein n=1 Tax=Nocardia mexicana TaxID=279262 RepID=A0A370GFT0_9NOCA|nr:hypothetical protein DFR68_12555 [Nocardia mexicana]
MLLAGISLWIPAESTPEMGEWAWVFLQVEGAKLPGLGGFCGGARHFDRGRRDAVGCRLRGLAVGGE